jgi:alpha-L-arabinofuranosidase
MLRKALLHLATVFVSVYLSLPLQAQQADLRNAGFEASNVAESWQVTTYGATPEVVRDTAVHHEGAASIRIQSNEPSDTALGQEIALKPAGFYVLSGWVKTENLNPHGAPVAGTLQVQWPGGKGIIASGDSFTGTTGWSQVRIPFSAPGDGRVRICVFYTGFGKGTGTAWFDGIKIEPIDRSKPLPVVHVTRNPIHSEPINPFQYGQFIEHLCTLVPGMWAEKLYDGSFEGLTPYKFVYLKETDFQEKPWYPVGATNRGEFASDPSTKISGKVSRRITALPGAPCTLGIAQAGIAVQKGTACKFRCFMKAAGFSGTVTVDLTWRGQKLATAVLHATSAWQPCSALLNPRITAQDCVLSIQFRGPGTLWLDNASLMPTDNVMGWRADVVKALKALKPGIIRYGGSTLDDANLGDFKWRDAVGDPDMRTPFSAWGGLQPAAAGLEEIVQLCHIVNAEPLICIRFENNSPQEAANEVEYFNGPPTSPMGKLRARNGHPQPYNIKYWQVGNERSGSAYENGVASFCAAMRGVDPGIKLLSSFPSAGVIAAAHDYWDYTCPHQYDVADLGGTAAELKAVRAMIKANGMGRRIKAAVTEWNTTAGDAGPRRAMLWNLENALACARYQNLLHRNSDLVEIANRSNLTNSFCSGIIQTDRFRLFKTPTYYMQMLYSTLAGTIPLQLSSAFPADQFPDISATLSADGKYLTVFAVNNSAQPIVRSLDFTAFKLSTTADTWLLADTRHAGEPDIANSFDEPERVAPQKGSTAIQGQYVLNCPPWSIKIIRCTVMR